MSGSAKLRFLWGALDLELKDGPGSDSFFTTSAAVASPTTLGCRRLVAVYNRGTEDSAITTHDFLNITSGAPDDTWDDADYAAIETGFIGVWAAWKSRTHTSVTMHELRWYKKIPGVRVTGPAVRITSVGEAGTSSADALPPQVALSVTERTALRKRWGRFYQPGLTETINTASGRPLTTEVDALGGAVLAFSKSGQSRGIEPVVISDTVPGAYSVDMIQVDDVWDVIRRRRYAQPSHRYDAAT